MSRSLPLEETPAPPVAAAADTGRDGEDRGADVLDVLVERVVLRELVLQRYEAGPHIALVGQEEQPGFEAAETVRAVGEGVAAAQDRHPVVAVRVREPYVGVGLHQLQVRRVAFVLLADRGAL